jgi:hypothetical protein
MARMKAGHRARERTSGGAAESSARATKARPAARETGPQRRAHQRDRVSAFGVVWIALAGALLLFAPPAANGFWGVNGLRSLPAAATLGLALVAAAAALPAWLRLRGSAWWWAIAVVLAIALAFPLREKIHLLGDTQLRLRALLAFSERIVPASVAEWSVRLHASPLDVVIMVFGPIELHRLGLPVSVAVSWVSLALALAFFAGVWRLAGVLSPPVELRVALALALALAGSLEAFAGYAESGGLLLAAGIWWWAELLAPLDRPARALRMAAAWVVLVLVHRAAAVMLLPQLWRALGPPLEGDRPGPRRLMLGSTLGLVVVLALGLATSEVGRQAARDARELLFTARAGGWRPAPADLLNALAVVAPLSFLTPALAGGAALAGAARSPAFGVTLAAAAPLLVALAWLFPIGGSGLGAHRDWDANLLLGLALTVAAAQVLARLPAPRLRRSLLVCLPLLALAAGGWVAVNAHQQAALRRAKALAEGSPSLPAAQRSHLELYLGQRAMDHAEPARGARHYERAYASNPNPRRALLAAEAWGAAGELRAARRALARARASTLDPELAEAARRIEVWLGRLEVAGARLPDSTARPRP